MAKYLRCLPAISIIMYPFNLKRENTWHSHNLCKTKSSSSSANNPMFNICWFIYNPFRFFFLERLGSPLWPHPQQHINSMPSRSWSAWFHCVSCLWWLLPKTGISKTAKVFPCKWTPFRTPVLSYICKPQLFSMIPTCVSPGWLLNYNV